MTTAFLLLLFVLVVAAIILALPQGRDFVSRRLDRLRRRPRPAPQSVVIDELGIEHPVRETRSRSWRNPADRRRELIRRRDRIRALIRRRYEWRQAIGSSQRLLASLIIILIGLFALWQLPSLLPSRLDRFTVLVAPFNERDGSLSQTGREVAGQLAQVLSASSARVRVQTIASPPADLQSALDLMRREGADALIWGTITPGGMLSQESLTPSIAYHPTGSFAPLAWEGYSGRFAMPEFYTISDAPINGQTVLPAFVGALADYGAGQVDAAFNTFGDLAQNTPALIETLPAAVRGNILWARGDYAPAADEYRRALSQAGRQNNPALPDPRALLSNNLGAIQQDAGDTAAAAVTFAQTVSLLAGKDLGALRYNLGLGYMRAGAFDDAATSLEIARKLLPPSAPLQLHLSQAYRMDGRLPQAREALNMALQLTTSESQATTAELREILGSRLRGGAAEQRGLLNLTEFLQAKGPLLWELQVSQVLDQRSLNDIRSDLADAVRETTTLAQGWSRRSAADDAAEHRIGGLLAINQFRHASELLSMRRLWDDALSVEVARVQGVEPPSGLAVLWSRLGGSGTAVAQARNDLQQLRDTAPNNVDEAFFYGQALLLTEGPASAAKVFDQAATDFPSEPEPPYGQALVAEINQQDQRAIDFLARAIRLDERYFPARIKLAELAEATQQWSIAVDQRRWLAQERPSFEQTLKLAMALRQSDPANYAEAEADLLGLINNNRIDERDKVPALTELSRLYYATQDWQAAHLVLERAQRAAPRDPTVAYELGRVLVAQGQTEAAAEQFQLAIDNDPQPVKAHLELAKFYTEQATLLSEQYTATAQTDPNDPQQAQTRIKLYADNINAADEQYRAALTAGANTPEDLQLIGDRLLARGDYASAATAYQQLVKLTPDDAAAHHGLAQANLQLDRLDAAQSEERKALTLQNDNYPAALAGLGDIALRRNRPTEAVQQYNAALQQDPNLAIAYIGLGRVAAAAGNWAVAGAHFQRAISADNRSANAHFWLGQAQLEQRDYNSAIAEYKQAIGIKPDYAEAYYGLARAQIAADQPTPAEASITAALAIRPTYDQAWLERGKLYEQMNNDTRALEAYNQAISANSKLAEARYRRGLLYTRQDNMSQAESDLTAAISAEPAFPEAHYWLGRVYLAQDRPAAARDEFKTAISQLGNNYPDARFYQGIAEEQLGQRAEAAASFQAALAQGSNSAWATDARAALARLGSP
jgi:tetratricopeptide (TPR) repeat protein